MNGKEELANILKQHPQPLNLTVYYHTDSKSHFPKDSRAIKWDDLKSFMVELEDCVILWSGKYLKRYEKRKITND